MRALWWWVRRAWCEEGGLKSVWCEEGVVGVWFGGRRVWCEEVVVRRGCVMRRVWCEEIGVRRAWIEDGVCDGGLCTEDVIEYGVKRKQCREGVV
jgi:hypothetical protein